VTTKVDHNVLVLISHY